MKVMWSSPALLLTFFLAVQSEAPEEDGSMAALRNPAMPPDGSTFVVLDAGSSGTRARLFQVKAGAFTGLPVPKDVNKDDLVITPGIDQWEQEGYLDKFQKVVNAAAVAVGGPERAKKTPIWLKATAGMRQLKFEDRDRIMKAVRKYMSETVGKTFQYRSARIIAGEEEAYFAWLETNYLAQTFKTQTIGTVEMGGASLQLDFFSDTDIIDEASYVVFAEKRWSLYAKSFLGYGAKEFGEQVEDAVSEDKTQEKSPCHAHKDGGAPDVDKCREIVKTLMRVQPDQCFNLPCGLDGRYIQPVQEMTFWGIGGGLRFNLAYVANAGCLADAGVKPGQEMPWPPLSQGDIEAGAICLFKKMDTEEEYDQLVKDLGEVDSHFEPKFFKNGPMLALYAGALLKAFNFPGDKKNFVLNGEVNNVAVGFPMGSLMYEIEQQLQADRVKNFNAEVTRCDSKQEKAFEAAILKEIL